MFRRIGRATLRPLLDHSHRRNPILREDARCSLTWWLDVLERGVAEHAAWEAREPAPPLLLWADARGSPARIAAVLYADGSWLYTDLAPDPDVMRQFKARDDNQIAGLEMLAVALGVSTWDRLIQGRSLRVFSDNTVAEWGFRKGTARELDHAALVHTFWLAMAALHVSVHIDRVPTGARRRGACVAVSYAKRAQMITSRTTQAGNHTSRLQYSVRRSRCAERGARLRVAGAKWCRPALADAFARPKLPGQLASSNALGPAP